MESVRKVPLDNDVQLVRWKEENKSFFGTIPPGHFPPISTKSGAVNGFRNFRGTSTTKSKQQTCVNTGRYYLFPFIVVLQKCHPIGPFLSPKAIFCSKFCFSFIWSTFRVWCRSFDTNNIQCNIHFLCSYKFCSSFIWSFSLLFLCTRVHSKSTPHNLSQFVDQINKSYTQTNTCIYRTILCHVVSGLWWVMLICYPKSILVLISGMLNLTPKVTQDNESTKVRNTHFSFVKLAFSKCFKFGETVTVLMQYPK